MVGAVLSRTMRSASPRSSVCAAGRADAATVMMKPVTAERVRASFISWPLDEYHIGLVARLHGLEWRSYECFVETVRTVCLRRRDRLERRFVGDRATRCG